MERQFLLTCSKGFEQALREFELDREEVIQNIFEEIKQKEDDLSLDRRRLFHRKYNKNGKEYILAGFVTKKEKAFLVEATDIWDKNSTQNIKIQILEK